jgi:hypothetical protein
MNFITASLHLFDSSGPTPHSKIYSPVRIITADSGKIKEKPDGLFENTQKNILDSTHFSVYADH